jgi:hypothetical protein
MTVAIRNTNFRGKRSDLPLGGWSRLSWCSALPCSPANYYILKRRYPDLIEEVKLGSAVIVLTPPIDFLRAVAARQEADRQQAKADAAAAKAAAAETTDTYEVSPVKRKRGRPRKYYGTPPPQIRTSEPVPD